MTANQAVTFITDGGDDDVGDLPLYLNDDSEHLLDWFHVTMRLTVMANMSKSLRPTPPDDEGFPSPPRSGRRCRQELGASQVVLLAWQRHGRPLEMTSDIETDARSPRRAPKGQVLKTLHQFDTYIRANAGFIPNYRERYRAGEVISSSLAESAVNQVIAKRMVKRQQKRWSHRGAHLLLRVRTRALNDDLAADFTRWYPGSPTRPKQPPRISHSPRSSHGCPALRWANRALGAGSPALARTSSGVGGQQLLQGPVDD